MQNPARLYEVLYVSTLAPDAPLSVVSAIAVAARIRNQSKGLTGLLIFDGMRFCQQLEGAQKDVMVLMERIRDDERHTSIEVIHHGHIEARRFNDFSLAYAPIDDADPLHALENLDGEAAIAAFLELVATLEPQS